MAKNLPDSLIDRPTIIADGWGGYQNEKDKTLLPFNVLTFPSQNCTIPDKDKIVPDKGKTLLGQPFDENVGIIGNKEKFKNLGGTEMEVRVYASGDATLRDVVQILYQRDLLIVNNIVGAFQNGEQITGANGSAEIVDFTGTKIIIKNIIGEFLVGDTITGLTSGATADIVVDSRLLFHPITEDANPLPRGEHEYYFDEWFDTNLDESQSRNLPRLIWVNGHKKANGRGEVYSWTGGVVPAYTVTATNITLPAGITWRSLGFTEDDSVAGGGNAYVVVNQTVYQLANPADLDTNSIDVTSTVGISEGDIVTSRIEYDEVPIPFDMCRQNKGYMFYGNWNRRDLYMSNGFNRPSTIRLISFAGGLLNDLTIPPNAVYTGTGSHIFHVQIDSVTPEIDINIQQFSSAGGIGVNDGSYDTFGYSGGTGLNTYKILIVADAAMAFGAAPAPVPTPGEVLTGNTSGAQAYVVSLDSGGQDPILRMFPGSAPFQAGETVTGTISGLIASTVFSFAYQDWFQLYENNILVQPGLPYTPPPGFFYNSILSTPGTPFNVGNGITFSFGNYIGHGIGDYWELTIQQDPGGPDTFKWWIDDQPVGPGDDLIPIVPNSTFTLQDGVQIQFGTDVGHTLGDIWNIQVDQSIIRAWVNFYYTVPVRKPGEGYIYRLPSNFWTMDTQEESMYVNGSYGDWSVVSTVLSGDLQSEDVSLTPLKQAGSNKVLYPYLTGHINNDLVYVTIDKKLDFIGRQQYLEKPQIGYLSEPVNLDFEQSTFVGGRIKYIDKKVYISSPETGITHCYDTFKKYWQPPKTFTEVGILSIVGNKLICHSHTRNQTFTMFTNDAGDNGFDYQVEIRTTYTSYGDRWSKKNASMSFTEGYIDGNPPLIHTLYLGVNGCEGVYPHDIEAIVCLGEGNAPFGEGSFGSHPFGSDVSVTGNYFQEIWKYGGPILEFYFASIGITCITKSHSYQILSLGLNGINSNKGNNKLVNSNNLVQPSP